MREDTRRIAQLFDTTTGIVVEHLYSTVTQEYPGLTQGRTVERLCDPCGAFRAGHLAPGVR
jgi:hypothetical protein